MGFEKLHYGSLAPIPHDAEAHQPAIDAVLKKRRVMVVKRTGEVSCRPFRIIGEREEQAIKESFAEEQKDDSTKNLEEKHDDK